MSGSQFQKIDESITQFLFIFTVRLEGQVEVLVISLGPTVIETSRMGVPFREFPWESQVGDPVDHRIDVPCGGP
jgi:hypothetical protein